MVKHTCITSWIRISCILQKCTISTKFSSFLSHKCLFLYKSYMIQSLPQGLSDLGQDDWVSKTAAGYCQKLHNCTNDYVLSLLAHSYQPVLCDAELSWLQFDCSTRVNLIRVHSVTVEYIRMCKLNKECNVYRYTVDKISVLWKEKTPPYCCTFTSLFQLSFWSRMS